MDPTLDKDLPLREDTRLLGRILGDMLREQTGDAGFERIEKIRRTAIDFRRRGSSAALAGSADLDTLLTGLDIGETLHIVRAFSYFSHLANIAEDVQQNRRRRAHALAGSHPQRGSLADALERLTEAGVRAPEILRWLERALVSPVLTAHPTEVQRKSILDAEREIARLLKWRDRGAFTPEEARQFETGLARQVLALWQTAMLRLSRLLVKDEIDNGLAYYRYTFFDELPQIYGALEQGLRDTFELPGDWTLPTMLRLGSWIGGDRDGNPFVTADTLNYAIRAQATLAFTHYLDEVHALGGELSLSSRLVHPTAQLLALAEAAHDDNLHRQDEPYRQALIGVYARLAATARKLAGYVPPRVAHGDLPPYETPAEFGADLATIERSLATHGARSARERTSVAASSRGRRVRIPPGRARPAAELRRARSSRRRAPRVRGCVRPTTRRSPRASASRCSRASSRVHGCCIRRTSTIPSARATSSRSSTSPPAFTIALGRRRCRTT